MLASRHPAKQAPPGLRRDAELIEIQPGLWLLVYWKALAVGTGAAIILQTDNEELMKFDCFGGRDGHYHVAPHYGVQLAFVEHSVASQIERAGAEIRLNGPGYIASHPRSEIQSIHVDEERLATAVDQAVTVMHRLAVVAANH